MASEYQQKAYTATAESLRELEEVSKAIGSANLSATIRYCIRQEFNRLLANKKEKAA